MQNFNRLTVDCNAIASNLKAIESLHPHHFRLMPMVKGAGYGTDAAILSHFLIRECGIEILGVSHVSEGIELRKKGITASIFVIGASILQAQEIVKYNLQPSVDSLELCEVLENEAVKQNKTIKVHLHCDTGLKRLGASSDEILKIVTQFHKFPSLSFEGLYTHFVGADHSHFDAQSLDQIQAIEILTQKLSQINRFPKCIHLSNSSGALRFKTPFCTMARTGIALFGIYCSEVEKTVKLNPALTLRSTLLSISTLSKGQRAGYYNNYIAQKPKERLAVIPIGYHDGIHLSFSSKGYVLIRGKKARMVGKIFMDFMTVDVTNIPDATVGDSVLIFGKDKEGQLPVETMSQWGTPNVRELICCLGPRITREFIYKDAAYDPSQNELREAICTL